MRIGCWRLLCAAIVVGVLAVAVPAAGAAQAKSCGSVSYTPPHVHGPGGVALNNLKASGTTCATARTVAKYFVRHNKAPSGWHAKSTTVKVHGNSVDEVVLTRRAARIVGDLAG